ncbi:MAG TPA: AMP-binding protein [Thermodesulfobacteriota bacterium]|nr:AMP-binding protein [Thermodesulfobacteriota bacterium]
MYQDWINDLSLGEFFDRQANKLPAQKALITPDQGDFTFGELKDISDQLAQGMMSIGVKRGDKIGVWVHNIPEWVFLFLGISKVGAVMVPINPNARSRDLAYYLKSAEIKVLFLVKKINGADNEEILKKAIPDLQVFSSGKVASAELPLFKRVIVIGNSTAPGFLNYEDLLKEASKVHRSDLPFLKKKISPLDPVVIKFTCGLTGYSRGAMLTHFGLINNSLPIAKNQNFGPSDILCLPIPFHYIFGFWVGLMACFSTHTPIVTLPKHTALEVLKLLEEKRCTALYGVPTIFTDILNHAEFSTFNLKSLRTGIMSGDFCPPDLMQQAIEIIPIPELTIAYGITEIGLLTQTSCKEKRKEKILATVGEPLEGMELKIINPQTGEDLPTGQKGEICVRTSMMMKGYYNMPQETAELMDQEGWFHTGDLGVKDQEGFYQITGRRRNMLIRGGENIYPIEVEKYLLSFPGVLDARVVGVPSRRLGEEAFAFVKTNNGVVSSGQSIREYFRNEISRHNIPRWITLVEQFPGEKEGATLDRNKLREEAIKEIKSAEEYPLDIIYEG